MTEKELFTLLQSVIFNGLGTLAGLFNIDVRQGYQPTIQGTPAGPAVLLTNHPARRYGFLKRADVWDADTGTMVHTETQVMTTQFQVGALWPQDPTAMDAAVGPTAGDLVNYVARVLQSDAGRSALTAGGCSILRVTDIDNPNFKDDRDQFESSPSFTFTLCHKFVDVSTVPVVSTYQPNFVAI